MNPEVVEAAGETVTEIVEAFPPEVAEAILERLDLICCILLLAVAVGTAAGVCYILYKVIYHFMTY